MPDPEDNDLARHSRVDVAIAATLTLSDLPPELILRIASFLEVRDLLALRSSRRFIYRLSQDKLLWKGLLRGLCLPQPRTLRSRPLESLSYPELEKAVLHSCAVEKQWLRRRGPGLPLSAMCEGTTVRFLGFLDDRWVISVPSIGPPAIWDTRESPPKLCESTSRLFLREIRTASVVVDPSQDDIVIGLWGEPSGLRVLRASLAELKGGSLRFTCSAATYYGNPGMLALEPSRSAIITELPGIGIQIRDWDHRRSVVINAAEMDGELAFEYVLGVRLVGDYILSFGSRRVELLYAPPFPDAGEQSTSKRDPNSRPFRLSYRGAAFTGASLSEPQRNPESLDDSRIVYVLARGLTVGFFYFRIKIYHPDHTPSEPRARMDIDLVGVYELSKPRVGIRVMGGPRLALGVWLGPEGKRCVWIERSSNALTRSIVAASFGRGPPAGVPVESGDDLRELCEIAPQIESTGDVFTQVESWNTDDDVIRCAFSESTGRIVLGTRDNRIILL